MLQFAHPLVEGRCGDNFADHKQTLSFFKAYILPCVYTQFFSNLFRDSHLPLDVTLALIMMHSSVRIFFLTQSVREETTAVKNYTLCHLLRSIHEQARAGQTGGFAFASSSVKS